MGRVLVLYTFFELNDRVKYFLKHGVVEHESKNVDYILICNHPTLVINTENLPVKHYMNRENVGYDFGAWSDALMRYTHDAVTYDYFIFVNASVWGPFLPDYYRGHWTDIFVNGLIDNGVQLFGCTINTQPRPHVQSYVFAMPIEILDLLCDEGIFSKAMEPTKRAAILRRELRMSQVVLENGGNIGCLMPYYRSWDFRQPVGKGLGDVAFSKAYFGETLHPYEVLFVKGTRNLSERWIRSYFRDHPRPGQNKSTNVVHGNRNEVDDAKENQAH
jgi:hypothetical protein